jgi:hypothetical protein
MEIKVFVKKACFDSQIIHLDKCADMIVREAILGVEKKNKPPVNFRSIGLTSQIMTYIICTTTIIMVVINVLQKYAVHSLYF